MKYLAAATLLCLAFVYHNRGEVLSLKSDIMYFRERIEALLTVIETICPDYVPEDYAHNRTKRALPLSVQLLLEKKHYERLYSVLTTCHAAPTTTPTTTPTTMPTTTPTITPTTTSNPTQYPSELCNRTNEHSDDYRNGTARLNCKRTPAAGQTWIAGALEVYLDNRWGYVCDDIYNIPLTSVGTVACRSLGGSLVEIREDHQLPEDRFAMDDLLCQGDEAVLTDCYRYITWQDNCRVYEGVFVNCTIPA